MNFFDVSSSQFENLKSRLAGLGYPLDGEVGTVRGPMGIVIDYEYNATEQSLFVQVVEKNFLVPCGRVRSELAKAVRESAT
jgi:hypothetical protein